MVIAESAIAVNSTRAAAMATGIVDTLQVSDEKGYRWSFPVKEPQHFLLSVTRLNSLG